jgi:hypothetical protein
VTDGNSTFKKSHGVQSNRVDQSKEDVRANIMTGDSISLVKSGEFIPVTKSAADDAQEATEEQ